MSKEVYLYSVQITPTCRKNRGNEGAWKEACHRLEEVYGTVMLRRLAQGNEATFELKLVEVRDERAGELFDN